MSFFETLEFAPMLLTDVFDSIKSSESAYDRVHLKSGEGQNLYLSQTQSGNSIAAIVPDQDGAPEPGNCITVTLKTQATFYQPRPFYAAQNFLIFRHERLDERSGLLLVTIIRNALGKFSWGYGVSMARLRRLRIMVPVLQASEGVSVVDWEGMARLGSQLLAAAADRAADVHRFEEFEGSALPELSFEPIDVLDVAGEQRGLFRAHKGRRLITAHRQPGVVPFVAGSKVNNSVVDYADVDPLFPAGWLTLIYNGDGGTGHAKYQPTPFSASDDVIVLEPVQAEATEDALMLVVTLLTQQCVPKFGFGYKLTLHRLGRQKIMVPVTLDAHGHQIVDWNGMTEYGRVLRARAENGMRTALRAHH